MYYMFTLQLANNLFFYYNQRGQNYLPEIFISQATYVCRYNDESV